MVFPGYGAELLSWLDRAAHVATFGAMAADHGAGQVFSVGGETVLRYNIAAGAVELLTGLPTRKACTSPLFTRPHRPATTQTTREPVSPDRRSAQQTPNTTAAATFSLPRTQSTT